MALSVGDLVATMKLDDQLSGKLLGVTASLTAIAGASIAMSAKFEDALTKMVSIGGVARDELQGVKEHILALAPAIGVGPLELADALKIVTSTTDDTATALQVLDLAAKASTVGMGDTKDVAKALISIVNSYGKENITAAHAMDVLTVAIKDGGAEANELAPRLANVVPQAAQLGISLEQVTANIAVMTKLGTPAAKAVTQLSSVMTAFLKETNKGKAALDSINLSYGELRKMAGEDLQNTLKTLVDRFGENKAGLAAVFGRIEALRNIMGTAGQQAEVYAEEVNRVTNSVGALDKAHKEVQGTTVRTWATFSAAVQVATIRLGDELAPALSTILQALTPVVEMVAGAIKGFSGLPEAVQATTVAVGGLSLVLAPVLSQLGPAPLIVGAFMASFLGVSAVLEAVPILKDFAEVAGGLAMKLFGIQAALDLYNKQQAKGVDVTKTWTEEQKAALATVVRDNQVRAAQQQGIDAVTGSLGKNAAATGAAAEAVKTWSNADIAAKIQATAEADKLAKATKIMGEEITDLPTAERIIKIAEGFEKAEARAKALAEMVKSLKQAYGDFIRSMQDVGTIVPDLPKLPDFLQPDKNIFGAFNDTRAMDNAAKMLSQGFSPERIKAKLMSGLQLSDAEAEGVLRALHANLGQKSWGETLSGSLKTGLANLPQVILGAIQGGGNVGEAVGASLGKDLGEGLGKKITESIGGKLGESLGALAGPLGTIAGQFLGKGLDALASKLGIGGNKVIMQVNDLRDAFFEAQGGFVAVQEKLQGLSNEDLVKKIFDARTVDEFNAAVAQVEGLLGNQAMAQENLTAAVERYGFTLEELPAKMKQDEIDANFGQILQDFNLLSAAGFDVATILERMGPSVSEFANQAVAAGGTIPEALRPVIEQLIASGQLLDENGVAFTSVEDAGITFAQTMTEQFQTLIEKITEMVNALLGIPSDVNTNVNIHTVRTESDSGGRDGADATPFATGGIVTQPTLGIVGESGPEAVVPLDQAASLGLGGPTMAELSPGAQRSITRALRDALLQAQG